MAEKLTPQGLIVGLIEDDKPQPQPEEVKEVVKTRKKSK